MASKEEFANSEEGKETAPPEAQKSEEQEEKETPTDDTSTEEKPESTEETEETEETKESQEKVDKALSQEKGLDGELKKLEEGNAERRNRIVELRSERRTQKVELGDGERNVQTEQTQAQTQEQPVDNNYDNSANYVIGEFVKDHPKYSTENDSGDEKWAELYRESELADNRPKNPFDVKRRLEKAHAYLESQNPTPKTDPAKEEAKKKSLEMAGQGAGGSGAGVPSKEYTDDDVKRFTDMGYSKEKAIEMAVFQKSR